MNHTVRKFYNIRFFDLDMEKQEEIIKDLLTVLNARAEQEGKEFLQRSKYQGVKSWQEAYCKEYAIDYQLWQDDEKGGLEYDGWADSVEEKLREKAEEQAKKWFTLTEVEVQI